MSDGVPIPGYFKTDSFGELNMWMDSNEKAPLLNVHCVQAIPAANQTITPPSFLLSGYGTSSKYTSLDILQRWLFIHRKSLEQNVRIIGFSTDADNKYMRAMRLMSGFYASMPHFSPQADSSAFSTQIGNWSWFYLRPEQLFLFIQDATHLVTKLRNRMLSRTADLRIGDANITIEHLQQIIDDSKTTKLDHRLTQTDIKPSDRQNFRSCLRITSSDVLYLLACQPGADGTRMYLQLIKLIITSYIEPETSIEERVKGAWTAVFLLRLWWVWLLLVRLLSLSSSKLNAHFLTYLVLLVQQQQLPLESLNIHLFSSQTCESVFRSTRSMSGVFSTVVNCTVDNFLKRSNKLSILNTIKSNNKSTSVLKFPIHHKHSHDNKTINNRTLIDVSNLNVERVVQQAYQSASSITESLNISYLLKKHNVFHMDALSEYLNEHLKFKSRLHDNIQILESQNNESDSEFDLDSDGDDEGSST
ncbi:unnamed protein product [Adineta ricciae]|uniref:Uncharacterized protein n=1 Tax=Adineta ricciae TaxID=249248 RepID=A0A815VWZ6_ADIRI|nr:unnamed protein product [Adineta ricciae]CAF1570568.1 unnamed protein product [Adineta ricciae]